MAESEHNSYKMASWWIFILTFGSINFAQNQPCHKTLPQECNCTEINDAGLNITCLGQDIVNITQQLPPNTVEFHYVALEMFVQLADTNFSHVPNLRNLTIRDPLDDNVLLRKIYWLSGNDKVFQCLDKLQTLAINVNWEMTTRLPGIFRGLTSLETLDLSNTRLMNIDNLIESLQGLRNSTKLTVLNLWNIKTSAYSSNLELDLGKVLEPLSETKLRVLNIGYNAFRSVRPGILQYAPQLKQIIVRNNALIPILTSSLMTEVLLHTTLEEADFSEQGFRPTDDAYRPSIQRNMDIPPELCNETTLLGSILRRSVVNSRSDPNDVIPIPPSVIAFVKKYITCFILLYNDTCNILEKECLPVKQILTEDHGLFCTLLSVFFQWHFSGIHCDYLPPFVDLISPDCGACLVIPTLGSLRTLKISELNVYDYVVQYRSYRGRPLCFHPNTSIEHMDLSRNDAHGYPEIYKVFHTDIRGLEKLKFINCSHNALDRLYANITSNFPNLKTIDASHNNLLLADKLPTNIAKSAEVVILSHNLIRQVPETKFAQLRNLKVLDLSYNLIHELKLNLSSSSKLKNLDLRGNSMISLHQFTIDQLNALSLSNSSHTLRINIGGNNLICACSTRSFVQWVRHSHPPNIVFEDMENYVCANRYSELVALHKISLFMIHFECYENIVYGCVGALSMTVLLGLALAYKRRFLLRHKLYKLNKRFKKPSIYQRSHKYDAFICFDTDDADWIDQALKTRLTDFRVKYDDEDVQFGDNVHQAVCRYVEDSYRSVLVLSPSFINSPNKMYHTRIIEEKLVTSGRDNIIVIVLKPLNRVGLDRTLKELMEHRLCLEWEKDNVDAQNYFWERLADAIGTPCEELYDTSHDERQRLLTE